MKFWTVQDTEVLRAVQEEGAYVPDFRRSAYLERMPELESLYGGLLRCFNAFNGVNLPGLVFAFAKTDGVDPLEIPDFEELCAVIVRGAAAIETTWRTLTKGDDKVLLELDYEGGLFNPLPIEFNDYSLIMPPVMVLPPYTRDDVDLIVDALGTGRFNRPKMSSGIVQVHVPFILRENLVSARPAPKLFAPR